MRSSARPLPEFATTLRAAPAALLFLLAWPVGAQFDAWTVPGAGRLDTADRREELELAVEEARWHVGRVRVEPWIGIKDAAYVDNLYSDREGNEVSDFTVTLGAGLRLYLPMGPSSYLAAHVLPEYVWWQDLSERRRVNGRYGAGFFGYFNRFTTEWTATRTDLQTAVTPEFQQYVNNRADRIDGLVQVQVARSLNWFVRASFEEDRHLLDEDQSDPRLPDLARLDRDETLARTGMSVILAERLYVAAGVEHSKVEFPRSSSDRSNSGEAPVLDLVWEGRAFDADIALAYRDLEPDGPLSLFLPFNDLTGSARFGLSNERGFGLFAYGSRQLGYAVNPEWSWFLNQKNGLSIQVPFGARLVFSAYGETGDQEYEPLPSGRARSDDTTTLGGSITFNVAPGRRFGIVGYRSEYDSNLEGFDRTITFLGLTLTFGELGWP